jgi:peptidoglycan hydrolase-like protein with peptidoglycan-binding domain
VFLDSRRTASEWIVALLLVALFALAPASATTKKRHHTSKGSASSSNTSQAKTSHGKHSRHSRSSRNWRHRGQQKVDAQRTQQIQDALVRANYLQGEPSGIWDAKTEDALRRYQSANGWQSKVVPDSRALIKLGLGPSEKKLINPESAMTSRPAPMAAGPNATTPQQ